MNIYFLVEGNTETKVYPKWLFYLVLELKEVKKLESVKNNNYYILSAGGYPSIKRNYLPIAIGDVNTYQQYNHLVVCLDAEGMDVVDKYMEITDFISNECLSLKTATLEIVIQNRCIETWFLGNREIYSENPKSEYLIRYTSHFNVSTNDPELMLNNGDFRTHAKFHSAYLNALFREKKIQYSKSNPRYVTEESYIQQLINRTSNSNHLATLKCFLDFCTTIKSKT
ncbi:MAG: hypothetical protein HQL03_01360 [Nitrospirae bacterium]|nr:hypothetical protein [Nitrospirota bacterium]